MKKKIVGCLACMGFLFFAISCNNSNERLSDNMATVDNSKDVSLFPRGERGSADWFTGEVYVQGLVNPDEVEGLYSVGSVTFLPGGKTNWHTHPIGQVLLVTEGKGWYQERGEAARPLTPGSVVVIPKDVEHWHGAAKDSKLVHIAISNIQDGSAVTWMTPVNDEEYKEVD